ncbi:hypothetical protein WCV48_27645 [Klebsiella pneumoniae]|nr:hypothetical protein [Klebsiella pneumoniae]MCL0719374.1 hypothetical protein [Klebsiella pneumoniae]
MHQIHQSDVKEIVEK